MVIKQDETRTYSSLSPETREKMNRSAIEVHGLPMREVKCPACDYVIARVYADLQGHFQARCRKCKLEKPLNLAYFRSQRGIGRLKIHYYGEDYFSKLNNT